MIESGLLSIRILLVKVTLKLSREVCAIDSVLKTNTWTYKNKDFYGEK